MRRLTKYVVFFLFFISQFSVLSFTYAEILDSVTAVVGDEVILLSELNEEFNAALKTQIEITREEVLNGLINRILILKEAKKFGAEQFAFIYTRNDEDRLISEYLDRRLRAFIRIHFDEIELFYRNNKDLFNGKDLYDVRDEIEKYLIEKEMNRQLILHIKELRKKIYVRIQLTTNEK